MEARWGVKNPDSASAGMASELSAVHGDNLALKESTDISSSNNHHSLLISLK
jgi:hypothetical protein